MSRYNMEKLDLKKETEHIVDWIKEYFVRNGSKDTKAIIGISGGKDSTVCAAACIKALGVDRVVGVLLPSNATGEMADNMIYKESMEVIEALGIKEYYTFNIHNACQSIYEEMRLVGNLVPNDMVVINTPARVRMTFLYAVAAQVGGRVCNTCNYSENYVGYSTKYGDHAGDFAPLSQYTVREVLEIGKYLDIPKALLGRIPSDGLCGVTDEDNLGFTYDVLDDYLLDDIIPEYDALRLIKEKHNNNLHKLNSMPECYRKYWIDSEDRRIRF